MRMRVARCAFLSTDDLDGFCVYDHLAIPALNARGVEVETIPWRAGVDWSAYDLVIVRSPWDYQKTPDAFLEALARIDAATRLANPLDVMRWNIDKRYLGELEARGVRIVPTAFFDRFDSAIARTHPGTERLVVKPAIGANADDTFVLDRDAIGSVAAKFAARACLVQPFVEAIVREGERSLFFFGGACSHAIEKRPAEGDFRVQEEHGGRFRLVTPSDDEVRAAEAALVAVDAPLLYARVDLVRYEGAPALMELELIEPSLYFDVDEGARERFADAVIAYLASA